jgi:glycosyltransferase involved in cell wall biosynthesis
MRIVLLTTQYPHDGLHEGGVATAFEAIAGVLTGVGHKVEVTVPSELKGERLGRFGERIRRYSRRKGSERVALPMASNRVIQELAASKPIDLIIACLNRGIAYDTIRQKAWPVVVRLSSDTRIWMRENDEYDALSIERRLQLEDATLDFADHVISPTKFLAENTASRMGRRPLVLRTPSMPDAWRAPSPWPQSEFILVCGAMEPVKGQTDICRSLEVVLDRMAIDVTFAFSRVSTSRSGCDTLSLVQRRLQRFGRRVQFLSRVSRAEMLSLISGARCAVFPARADNLPNALIEAMCCGTICVLNDISAYREIIRDRETGFICSTSDSDKFAQTLIEAATLEGCQRSTMQKQIVREARCLFDPMTFLDGLRSLVPGV